MRPRPIGVKLQSAFARGKAMTMSRAWAFGVIMETVRNLAGRVSRKAGLTRRRAVNLAKHLRDASDQPPSSDRVSESGTRQPATSEPPTLMPTDSAITEGPSAPGAGWCPACGNYVDVWLDGPGGRKRASCGTCWSLERHRLLAAILHNMRPYVSTMGAVLECAPQIQIQNLLRNLAPEATYIGTDLFDLRFASVSADGCHLPFADGSFDLVLSFHVLEHIPNDAAAMRELCRVLKPGGLLICQVPRRPGVPTEEDYDASPEEKARRFGQSDHVRYYGDDFEDRLERVGLQTTYFEASDLLTAEKLERFNIPAKNPLWICRPSSAAIAQPLSAPGLNRP